MTSVRVGIFALLAFAAVAEEACDNKAANAPDRSAAMLQLKKKSDKHEKVSTSSGEASEKEAEVQLDAMRTNVHNAAASTSTTAARRAHLSARRQHEEAHLVMASPSAEDYGRLSDPNDKWSPIIWDEARQAFHERLVGQAVDEMMAVAELMKDHEPGVYCLRGNTAAGKSTAIAMGLIPTLTPLRSSRVADMKFKALNPDPFKEPLMAQGRLDGKDYSHMDVHTESSNLCEMAYQAMLKKHVTNSQGVEVPASFAVDQRLAWQPQIDDDIIPNAQASSRKVFIYDIDCPLRLSLMGVLKREKGGEDPIPPFGAVAYGGYAPIEENRQTIIDIYTKRKLPQFFDALGDYRLFATKTDYSKVQVMWIRGGDEHIIPAEQDNFDHLREIMGQNVVDGVSAIGHQTIDAGQIEMVCGDMEDTYRDQCRQVLCPWSGQTWEASTDIWAGVSAGGPHLERC